MHSVYFYYGCVGIYVEFYGLKRRVAGGGEGMLWPTPAR